MWTFDQWSPSTGIQTLPTAFPCSNAKSNPVCNRASDRLNFLRDVFRFTLKEPYRVVASPRIGVAALNPHAGEAGAFGDEEIREIAPAVEAVRSMGISATGPHPADTIFVRAMNGEFDGIVFLYHDQGNISMHVAGFGKGVMIYTGLPFPCTGPTHGTAYDIAGQAKADPVSFQQAVKMACQMLHVQVCAE